MRASISLPSVAACLTDIAIFSGLTLPDRAAWQSLPRAVRLALVEAADTALAQPFPQISAGLYGLFCQTGDRATFEAAYFARRRMLNAMVIGEAVEGKGRFCAVIDRAITQICDEPGWQLPAHNSQSRGGKIAPQPDPKNPVVDLFAAETAALLAVAASLVDTQLSARIDAEIQTRVLTPYLTRQFWWTGQGGGRMNNWTVWCTQNILIAALSRPAFAGLRGQIAERAGFSLDAFLAEYGDDGACPEGVYYYKHAALCLFTALDLLNTVSAGSVAPVFASQKLRNIAEFLLLAHIDGDNYANFGDAAAKMAPPDPRVYRFAKAVGSADLAHFALRAGWASDPLDISLYDRVQALFTARETAKKPSPREGFAPSIGLFVARDPVFFIAATAGSNGNDHNHNDVGSVILYKNGAPVLIDLGVETYTAETFSTARYDIWTMQSSFHNLPEFGGVMQQAGVGFDARDVRSRFTPDEALLDMDIAGAYPPEARLVSYQRRVLLRRGRGVSITDHYDGELAPIMNLILAQKPKISAGQICVGDAQIILTGAGRIEVEEIEITDPRLAASWPGPVYRARLTFSGQSLRLEIT
ncbi:MAG: heparinase [Robiginitomaculum sp.]|nr:MAG: heparinase [Robiginitomaculum sp.]